MVRVRVVEAPRPSPGRPGTRRSRPAPAATSSHSPPGCPPRRGTGTPSRRSRPARAPAADEPPPGRRRIRAAGEFGAQVAAERDGSGVVEDQGGRQPQPGRGTSRLRSSTAVSESNPRSVNARPGSTASAEACPRTAAAWRRTRLVSARSRSAAAIAASCRRNASPAPPPAGRPAGRGLPHGHPGQPAQQGGQLRTAGRVRAQPRHVQPRRDQQRLIPAQHHVKQRQALVRRQRGHPAAGDPRRDHSR